jgi:hypothetical protein
MAHLIVNQGLQNSAKESFNIAGGVQIQSMAWDTGTGAGEAFAAGDTALNAHGAVTVIAKAFDATFPSISGQVVTVQATLATTDFNGNTIGRISIHTAAFGSVTSSSTTLYGGVDQQSIAKTSDFSLVSQLTDTFTSA